MHGGIVRDLHLELELCGALLGDGGAEDASAVAHHEVDLLGRDLLGRDDEVAFVLSILVIDDDDELAVTEVLEGLLYRV